MTTFARIAKILKGLVEPRNEVEKAFSQIETNENIFEVHVTGTVSAQTNYMRISVNESNAKTLYDKLTKYDVGAEGVIIVDDGEHLYRLPAYISNKSTRIGVEANGLKYFGVDNNHTAIYNCISGSTSTVSGTFYIWKYTFAHATN